MPDSGHPSRVGDVVRQQQLLFARHVDAEITMVCHQVVHLHLGTRLFQRTTRSLTLTEAGKRDRLIGPATASLDAIETGFKNVNRRQK